MEVAWWVKLSKAFDQIYTDCNGVLFSEYIAPVFPKVLKTRLQLSEYKEFTSLMWVELICDSMAYYLTIVDKLYNPIRFCSSAAYVDWLL